MPQRVPIEISCAIEGSDLQSIKLVFSIDHGQSWYEVDMYPEDDLYKVIIPNLEIGTELLYAFRAITIDGEEYLEDNNGAYYSEKAVLPTDFIDSEGSNEVKSQKSSQTIDSKFESINDNLISAKEETEKSQISKNNSRDQQFELNNQNYQQISTQQDLPRREEFHQKKSKLKTPQIQPSLINQPPSFNLTNTTSDQIYTYEKGLDQQDETAIVKFSPTPRYNINKLESEQTQTNQIYPKPFDPSLLKSTSQNSPEISNLSSETSEGLESQKDNEPVMDQTKVRPIIPYNPFTPDDGELGTPKKALLSFSQIIGAKSTTAPRKKKSFIKKPELINLKRCSKCSANVQKNWKICAICGSKL